MAKKEVFPLIHVLLLIQSLFFDPKEILAGAPSEADPLELMGDRGVADSLSPPFLGTAAKSTKGGEST